MKGTGKEGKMSKKGHTCNFHIPKTAKICGLFKLRDLNFASGSLALLTSINSIFVKEKKYIFIRNILVFVFDKYLFLRGMNFFSLRCKRIALLPKVYYHLSFSTRLLSDSNKMFCTV